MNVDALLERLDQVQPVGNEGFIARCPAHEDTHASLRVSVGSDRILLHCFAGCAFGDVMTALGLDWRDVFLDNTPPMSSTYERGGPVKIPRRAPVQSRRRDEMAESRVSLPTEPMVGFWWGSIATVAERLYELKGWSPATLESLQIGFDGQRVTIPVRDAEGRLLTVLRYLPGGRPKMLALNGRGRHLYPAPEDFGTVRDGRDIWLVEGEPDAISAHELGLEAVAVPGVAVWLLSWPERFTERRVTICMDCDVEGRNCARRLVREFRAAGVQARIVDLDPERSDGTDLGDLLTGAVRERRVGDLKAFLTRLQAEAWS